MASGGRSLECTWTKGGDADPLELTFDDEPVALAPGNTWIELVPVHGSAVTLR